MLFFKSVSNIFFTEELIALGGCHHDSEGAVKKRLAGVQGPRGRLARGRRGGRPARQEARARRLHRQQRRQRTAADTFYEPSEITLR